MTPVKIALDGQAHPFQTLVQVSSIYEFLINSEALDLEIYNCSPSCPLRQYLLGYRGVSLIGSAYPFGDRLNQESHGHGVTICLGKTHYLCRPVNSRDVSICSESLFSQVRKLADGEMSRESCCAYLFSGSLSFEIGKYGNSEPLFFLDFELLDVLKNYFAGLNVAAR